MPDLSSFELLDGITDTTLVLRMRFAGLEARVERLRRDLAEERGRRLGGWISVSNRLPERDVQVLAWDGTPYARILRRHFVAYIGPFGWASIPGDYGVQPTHWMPLPEPPK